MTTEQAEDFEVDRVTDAIDDMLYTLAKTTGNDGEPSDRELAVLREIVERRLEEAR